MVAVPFCLAFAFVVAVLIEFGYSVINAIGAIAMATLFWTLAVLMLFVPTVVLLRFPTMYNALTVSA